jgi:hypothetical protein
MELEAIFSDNTWIVEIILIYIYILAFFDVLLTVHLSIFISVRGILYIETFDILTK